MSRKFTHAPATPPPSDPVRLLVLTTMGIAYMREVTEGVREMQRECPWLSVAVRDVSPRAIKILPDLVRDAKAQGIIGFFARHTMIEGVQASGLPAITVSEYLYPTPMPCVVVDNTAVGRLAADHLIGRGLKCFACLGQAAGFARKREAGFVGRLAEVSAPVQILDSTDLERFALFSAVCHDVVFLPPGATDGDPLADSAEGDAGVGTRRSGGLDR